MDQFNQSGNADFNQVPDWYANAEPVAPPAPPAPPAPAAKGRRAARSPIASANDPHLNPNAAGSHQGVYNPVAQGVPHGSSSNRGGGGVGRFVGGAVAKIAIVAVFLGGGFLLNLGTKSAEALEQGDCFIMADELEIDRVDTTDCNDAHDSQVIGVVTVEGPSVYPDEFDPYWETVFATCDNLAVSVLTNIEAIPFDAQMELLTPLEGEWNRGGRESICVMRSETGLNGSFVLTTG